MAIAVISLHNWTSEVEARPLNSLLHTPLPRAPIPFDLPCVGCRYNLRALTADATCPECGTPITKTLDHGWLIFADPDWLRRLRSGFCWFLLTLLVGMFGIVATAIWVHFIIISMGSEPNIGSDLGWAWAIGLPLVSSWLMAIWRVTAPEPELTPVRKETHLDVWIRTLNVVAALSWVPYTIGAADGRSNDSRMPIASFAFGILMTSAFSLGLVLLLIHLRRLSRRNTKPTLGKLLTFLLWGGIALTILTAAGAAGSIYLTSSMRTASAPSPTSTYVRARPLGVSVSWSPPLTTATTSAPPPASAPLAPTKTTATVPARPPSGMLIALSLGAVFYFFVVVWCVGGLIALIGIWQVLRKAINENASANYSTWMNSGQI